MRLIFFGTGSFAVPSLRRLAPSVVLVVTQPDRPSGRGHHRHPSPIRELASSLSLPVATPEKARDPEFVEQIRLLKPDALVVASYGQILSQSLLDSARRGGINLHGSLLPQFRGAAPIQRAILEGCRETGITLMQMDRGMDTGDIIMKRATPIEADETYGELQDRLSEVAASLAEEWIPRIVEGSYSREVQNSECATIAGKVEKSEAELRFERPAITEYNRFRAFTPSPGAYLMTERGILRISGARMGERSGQAGIILGLDSGCEVGFADGSLRLLEVQPEGKKRMSGRDYANGLRLRVGDSLLSI